MNSPGECSSCCWNTGKYYRQCPGVRDDGGHFERCHRRLIRHRVTYVEVAIQRDGAEGGNRLEGEKELDEPHRGAGGVRV